MKHIQLLILASYLAFALAEDNISVWEVRENSSQQIVFDEISNIDFNPTKSFIILVTKPMQYRFYYLVGTQLSQPLRFKTVEQVMKIKRILSRNHTENALDNSFIIRETHEHASYKFQKQFSQIQRRKENIPPQRMYRISSVHEEIRFQQVPLQFSELTLSDAFVLDSGKSVTIFSLKSKYPNPRIEIAANNIGNFIYNENGYKDSSSRKKFLKNCLQWSPREDECYSKFIQKLEGHPKLQHFNSRINSNQPEEIPEFCQYRLLKPLDGEANFAEIEFIVDYNKTLAVFNNTCYIFILEKVHEVFIYIRDFKNEKNIIKCLKFGEGIDTKTHLVSVVQKIRPITPFLIIFKEFWQLFSSNNFNYEELKNNILLIM